MQTNRYQLALMNYLQFEAKPLAVPECIRDYTAMFDAATVPDLYEVCSCVMND